MREDSGAAIRVPISIAHELMPEGGAEMNTMTAMTDLESISSAPFACGAPSAVRLSAPSIVISLDSAFGMDAYAAAPVVDGRVFPCAPVVTQKRTEVGVATAVSTKSSFSSKRCLVTHATNPANSVVKTWPLRPSGICGAPPG